MDREMKFKMIDLFCGAGGKALGFIGPKFCGGFEAILALDTDKASVQTYNENFGNHAIVCDIEDFVRNSNQIPKADIVIGGPPCQGFSPLNKNRDGDARRELWRPFIDVVRISNASCFVMENVPELLKSTQFDEIIEICKGLGFSTSYGILLAADYGTPQTRKRAFIIGWKRELFIAPVFPPPPTHAAPNTNPKLPHWLTVRDAISDLIDPVGTEIRQEMPPLDLHFGRNPSELSVKRYHAVPPGGNRFDLAANAPEITPQCWLNKKTGSTDLFGRLWWDRPSVTIRTEFFKPEKGRYLHPEKHRPISHREGARLMGFPDDFVFKGTKIEIAKQIGNAVPPQLAGAVARIVYRVLCSPVKAASNHVLKTKSNTTEQLKLEGFS